MKDKIQIAVIGSGSWATALVKILLENNYPVNWWVRNEDSRHHISSYGHNPRYLQSVELDQTCLTVLADVKGAIANSEVIIVATPSAFITQAFHGISREELSNKLIFSAVKGFIADAHMIPANYFNTYFGVDFEHIGIICGPCHAEEVGMEKLSFLTVACPNSENALKVSRLLACRYISTKVSNDILGLEYAAVLKNVYALAGGISAGLGYGDNYLAILVSNAIQEIERFIDVVAPAKRDVKISGYLGDLLVTAYSNFSRNRTFGVMIGKGYSVKSAQLEMNMIAEGYYALKSIHVLNEKYAVHMPIMETVYDIVYNKKNPKKEFIILSEQLK